MFCTSSTRDGASAPCSGSNLCLNQIGHGPLLMMHHRHLDRRRRHDEFARLFLFMMLGRKWGARRVENLELCPPLNLPLERLIHCARQTNANSRPGPNGRDMVKRGECEFLDKGWELLRLESPRLGLCLEGAVLCLGLPHGAHKDEDRSQSHCSLQTLQLWNSQNTHTHTRAESVSSKIHFCLPRCLRS